MKPSANSCPITSKLNFADAPTFFHISLRLLEVIVELRDLAVEPVYPGRAVFREADALVHLEGAGAQMKEITSRLRHSIHRKSERAGLPVGGLGVDSEGCSRSGTFLTVFAFFPFKIRLHVEENSDRFEGKSWYLMIMSPYVRRPCSRGAPWLGTPRGTRESCSCESTE